MSKGAIVDGQKLRLFAQDLKQYVRKTDDSVDQLARALGTLGKSWKDPAFDEFEDSVRKVVLRLLSFVEKNDKFCAYLELKAEEADAIHDDITPR